MRKLFNKFRSRRGMTLTEILVTLLITSLTALVVAAGVSASMRVYRESTAYSDAQTLTSILVQAVMDELRFAADISEQDASIKYTSKTYGSDTEISSIGGRIKVNDELLLPESVYGNFMANAEISYFDGSFAVKLTVLGGDGNILSSVDVTVCPLGNS